MGKQLKNSIFFAICIFILLVSIIYILIEYVYWVEIAIIAVIAGISFFVGYEVGMHDKRNNS